MTRADWSNRKGRSSSWITKARRLAIYIRDEFHCCYCGEDLKEADAREIALDHLQPQCKGGSNKSTNLVTACRRCNSARQERPWKQYATGGAIERIQRQRRRVVNVQLAKTIINGEPNPNDR